MIFWNFDSEHDSNCFEQVNWALSNGRFAVHPGWYDIFSAKFDFSEIL